MSWFKDYLSFSKRERNAIIVVIILLGGFIILPDFFSSKKVPAAISDEVRKELAAVSSSPKSQKENEDESWQTPFSASEKREVKLFTFDPNSLDEEGFITLGLPERTARTIINYRNKGGKFRKPEDLRKIYSLKKEDADRIIPYARIENSVTTYSNNYPCYEKREYTSRTINSIDINTATVEEWKALPGIGEVLSNRIVKFREKLNGFASIDQVAKTYGLKDSTFQLIKPYLKLSAPAVNKININTAFENELMECSAISKDVAQAIVIYRKKYGNFHSVEDLKKIVFINEEMFQKIIPCVKVN
jgi:competence ComEA-like helix-hairpin-helix protein